MADELKTKRLSELPLADALSDVDALVGNQNNTTKRFLLGQIKDYFAALLVPFSRNRYTSLSDVLRKAHTGQAISIACIGDSLTYGQDTSASGVNTQINGASQKRSTAPYPEKLAESLGFAGFSGAITVINRGYPGDTAQQGLTRWDGATATDLAILMYGTNEAQNYGGLGVVEMQPFRVSVSAWIDRLRAQGTAVILMTPPPIDSAQDLNIRPYADCLRSIGQSYGIPVVSASEQLGTLSNLWTDAVHLTSQAYREMGWHLAALFTRRDGAALRVGPGSLTLASENIGYGGSRSTWSNGVDVRELVLLNAGQTLAVAVYCEETVQPIVHSVNATASGTILRAYNSAGILGAPQLNHDLVNGTLQQLYCVPLKRGLRVIYVRNEGTTPAYVSGVEFAALNIPAMGRKNSRKVPALCGSHVPSRANLAVAAGSWMSIFSYEYRVTPFGGAIFKVRLPNGITSGVAIINSRPNNLFPVNACIFAIREGVNLLLRQYVNDSTIVTVTVSAFFTSGADWTGELELAMPSGASGTPSNVILYANGVQVAALPTPVVTGGWPGLVCMGALANTPTCESAYIYGYDKEPV
jgi:lysophospholipase L1-like esterase